MKMTISLSLRQPAVLRPTPSGIREAAEASHRHLSAVSQACRLLEQDRWVGRYYQHAIFFQHPHIHDEDAARSGLLAIGLDPARFGFINEWESWARPKQVAAPDEGVFAI